MSVSLIDGHIDRETGKITDKEIIKALEISSMALMYNEEVSLYKLALDLINRQQAEIERLNEDKSFLKDEFERFRIRVLPIAKSEAIKEFAERLKEHKYSICAGHGMTEYAVSEFDIDNLVKEMVGEDK